MEEEIKKEEEVLTEEQLQEKIADGVKSAFEGFKNEVIAEVKTASQSKEEMEKKAFDAFGQTLKDGIVNQQFKATASTSTMGSVIPTIVNDYIITERDKYATMRPGATVFRLNGQFQIPNLTNGVTTYWIDENQTINNSEPTTGSKTLTNNYLACRVLLSKKLTDMSNVDLVNFFVDLIARKIAETEDDAFTNGDGSGKPTGFRGATLPASHVKTQASTHLTYDDLITLFYALPQQYRTNAVFQAPTSICAAIRKIKDTNGQPIFDPTTNRVFGKELIENTNIPDNLGTDADKTEIYFGDRKEYWIKDGQDMAVDVGTIRAALQTEIVVSEAVDGALTDVNAFAKLTEVKA